MDPFFKLKIVQKNFDGNAFDKVQLKCDTKVCDMMVCKMVSILFKCMLRPDSTHLFVIKYGDQCAGDATESGLTAEQQSDANVFIFFRSDFEIDLVRYVLR